MILSFVGVNQDHIWETFYTTTVILVSLNGGTGGGLVNSTFSLFEMGIGNIFFGAT